MNRIYFKLKVIVFFIAFFIQFSASAQERTGNEPLAIEYFKSGDFGKALPLFTELYKNSPDNVMYNYYYGITLFKTHHYETATKEALLNAVVSNSTPSNVNFYLGNYFQALNNWGEALDFYARYKGNELERSQLQFDKYVDLCRKKINPFVSQNTEKAVFLDTIKNPVKQPDEKNFPIPEALKNEWFNFQINAQLTYHRIEDFKSEAAKVLFTKAWLASMRRDSIVGATELLRKAHEQTNNVTTRLGLVDRIVDAEQKSYQLVRDQEKYFDQARVKESTYWEKADPNSLNEYIMSNSKREKEHDSLLIVKSTKTEKEQQDTGIKVPSLDTKVPSGPVITKEEPQLPENNLVFKVQIGSYPNGKISTPFKTLYTKLSKLRKIDEYTDERKYKIFTVGNFDNYNDATTLRNQLIREGVKGPFIIAYKNGVKIPITDVIKPNLTSPNASKPNTVKSNRQNTIRQNTIKQNGTWNSVKNNVIKPKGK